MKVEFQTKLVPGGKVPYHTWTFVVLPPKVLASLGGKTPLAVRGTLAGAPFRGTVSKGEGVCRMPVPRSLRDQAGVSVGSTVKLMLEVDLEPRPVEVPEELRRVLAADPDGAQLFESLPPAHRRAWAAYVSGAKQAETRRRRAAKAPAGIRTKSFPR